MAIRLQIESGQELARNGTPQMRIKKITQRCSNQEDVTTKK